MAEERVRVVFDIDAEISKAQTNIQNLTKVFDNVGGSKGNQLRELVAQIGQEYEKLGNQSGKTMSKVGDFSQAEKSSEKLNSLLKKLGGELTNIGKGSNKELSKLFPPDVANRIAKANDAIKTYNSAMKKSESGKGAINQATQAYEKQVNTVNKLEQEIKQLEQAKKTGTAVSATTRDSQQQKVGQAEKAYKDQLKVANAAQQQRDNYAMQKNLQQPMKSTVYKDLDQNFQKEIASAEQLRVAYEQAKETLNKMYVPETVDKEIENIRTSLGEAKNKADEFKQNLNNVKATEVTNALEQAKAKLQDLTGVDLSKVGNIQDLENLFQRFTQEGIEGLRNGLQQASSSVQELGTSNEQVRSKINQTTNEVRQQNAALEDVNGLKSRIQYFFSLTNSVMLARRVLRETFETIKELDATMAETAVVTDFSVGDMWDQMPRYTEAANELGTTILGAYQTMTLFYQQGLETNEVFQIGSETMKMARIAGIEYSEATNLMTAALRGFNMELNDTSATRINDIYSKLAAITAADTQEIATAMTKTASIAFNANMEFETTAALLAQIIETTREPAETAGTAMKTIIARFTEMKKSASEVVDVEGEEVNANKVEAALKSAGVALRNTNGEFRNLDQVFLELAGKWDKLDMMTQRYIATTAAGSRQQSRFIAMMQNYDRTMELVDASYNSAGASAIQFAKTQESLESKLNELSNATTEFLTTLANSDVVKGVIDLLSGLLNVLNNVTAGTSSFAGSLLKIFTLVVGFSITKSLFNSMFLSFTQTFRTMGQESGQNFNTGLESTIGKIKTSFPFFGIMSKNLRALNKEIRMVAQEGMVNLQQLGSSLDKSGNIGGMSALRGFSGQIGASVMQDFEQQIQQYGNLTDEGREWANTMIQGAMEQFKSGELTLSQTLETINSNLRSKLVNVQTTTRTDANGNVLGTVSQPVINKQMITPNESARADIMASQNYTGNMYIDQKQIMDTKRSVNELTMALSAVGMLASSAGNALEGMGGTAGKVGKAITLLGGSLSTAGMAVYALGAAFRALGHALSTGPLIVIAAVAAAISLVVGAINAVKEAQETAQKVTLENAKTAREEAEANRELVKTLEETIDGYQEGANTRQDVIDASEELLKKYDLESEKVLLLTGNYEQLAEAIRNKLKAEEEANIDSQSNAIATSKAQLVNAGLSDVEHLGIGLSAVDEVSVDNDFKKETNKLLEDTILSGLIEVGSSGTLSFKKSINSFSNEELIELHSFLSSYSGILGDALTSQDKKLEDSEVYLELSKILEATADSFNSLQEATDSQKESLKSMARIDFEKSFDFDSVKNRKSYKTGEQEFIRLMQNADKSLTYEEAQKLAQDYFLTKEETRYHAEADRLILELSEKFGTENLAALSIYEKYANGEISAEEFVRLLISVDIEQHQTVEEVNKSVEKSKVLQAISAPTDFAKATVEIGDYLKENFTIEGIDDQVLQDFETQLTLISATLPEGINLLDDWNEALKQGTLGISKFFIETQQTLSKRTAELKEAAHNLSIYGISGTDAELTEAFEKYAKAQTDKEREEIAKQFGLSRTDFETAQGLYTSSFDEQKKTLEDKKAEEEKKYNSQTGYIAAVTAAAVPIISSTLNGGGTVQDVFDAVYSSGAYTSYANLLTPDAKTEVDRYIAQSIYDSYDSKIDKAQEKYDYYAGKKAMADEAQMIYQWEFSSQNTPGTWSSKNWQAYDYLVSKGKTPTFERIGPDEENGNTSYWDNEHYTLWKEFYGSKGGVNKTEYLAAEKELKAAQEDFKNNETTLTTKINAEVKYDDEYERAKKALEDFENKDEYKVLLEIEVAAQNAQQIALLQTQLNQIKDITSGKNIVDISEFEQLAAITPEIARYSEVLADGSINISKAVAEVNRQLEEQIANIQETTGTTLKDAIAQEKIYNAKLVAIRDNLKAQIQAGKKTITIDAETEKKIVSLTEDGAYERAKIANQEAEDTGNAAVDGANVVINSVESMDDAYVKLGATLDTIHEKMMALGDDAAYKETGELKEQVFDDAKDIPDSQKSKPDKSNYSSDTLETNIANGKYTVGTTVSIEEAEALVDYFEGLLTNSDNYLTELQSLYAWSLGGGKTKDEEGGEKDTSIDKLSDKIKSKIDEIDSAIKDLADNDIIDMRMINDLISQKIALQKEYKYALEQELSLLSQSTDEIWRQVKASGNDKYIQYSEESGLYGYTDAYYKDFYKNGLAVDSEKMQKVEKQLQQLNSSSDDSLSNQVAIKEMIDNLITIEAENYNAERQLKARERKQEELDSEKGLADLLPEEIKPVANLFFTTQGAMLEYKEIQANRVLEQNKRNQLDAAYEGVNEVVKQYMTYDEYSGYGIDFEKINTIENAEARDDMLTAVKANAEVLNVVHDDWYELHKELSGGRLQKVVANTSKALKDFAKEISDGDIDTGLKKINTGFEALDDALNSLIKNLEDNEAIEDILSTKVLPSLSLNEEQMEKLVSSEFVQKILKDNIPMQQFVLEATGTEGISLGSILGAATGGVGDFLEDLSGLMNFDMMEILGGSDGLIAQGKQMAEQVIGYITEATQALIDAWTNREDYLYNFLQILERYLHEYEVMQRYSTQLEKGRVATVDDIRQNWEQQWQSLQDQLEMQKERVDTRQQQLDMSRWNPFALISGWDPTSDALYENREIKMAFDLLISAIGMLPMGLGAFGDQLNSLYEDYDKRVQDAYQDRLEAEMAILDIEDERLELVKIGADEATEFEQKVLEALIAKEQEQIDELSRLNDAVTDANSKLISTLQSNLDKLRQDRENEKKEEELSEKQRRLSYLRQDTSGANMLEIKNLEEQLEDEHEDYTDTLIDQKISELEEQNEKAAEQRQQQIELLQAQLDWSEKYGLYWDAVYGMLYTIDENGKAILNPENFDLDGNIRENSQLAKMLGTFSDQIGMSVWSRVLDNEENKRLGRYYGAFIGNNGVTGEWADYWALLNPGADDPDYATRKPQVPEGIWGVLYEFETTLAKYFGSSNTGLWNMGERFTVGIQNVLGKVFNIEEWANATAESFAREDVVGSITLAAKDSWDNLTNNFLDRLSFGNKTGQSLTGNNTGTKSDSNEGITNKFDIFIDTFIGEDSYAATLADRISSMFTTGIPGLQSGNY